MSEDAKTKFVDGLRVTPQHLNHLSARGRVGCLCPREQPQGAQLLAGQRQRIDVVLDLIKGRALVDHRVYGAMLIGQHPGFLSLLASTSKHRQAA